MSSTSRPSVRTIPNKKKSGGGSTDLRERFGSRGLVHEHEVQAVDAARQYQHQRQRAAHLARDGRAQGRLVSLDVRVPGRDRAAAARGQDPPRPAAREQLWVRACEAPRRHRKPRVQGGVWLQLHRRDPDEHLRPIRQLVRAPPLPLSESPPLSRPVLRSDLEDSHVIPGLIHKCYLAKSTLPSSSRIFCFPVRI